MYIKKYICRECLAVILLGSLLLGGCGFATAETDTLATEPLTVFAAASLTNVFQQIAQTFSDADEFVFNFAGSQQLASQLHEGAVADVFAAAAELQMQAAVDAGRVEKMSVRTFACNRLVVAAGSEQVDSLKDLAEPGHKIIIGAEAVPVGHYTRQFLAKAAADSSFGPRFQAGFEANVVSEEQNVRVVLSKVQLGEADAGVVYASDLMGVTDVKRIEIPAHLNVTVRYPIGLVQGRPHPKQAQTFITFIFSEKGIAVLESYGFSTHCRDASDRGNE